jgi:hypothetical protein
MYGDDVYILTEDGLVIERGRIDGMWEDDEEYNATL